MIGNDSVDERSLLQTKSPGWNHANTFAAQVIGIVEKVLIERALTEGYE